MGSTRVARRAGMNDASSTDAGEHDRHEPVRERVERAHIEQQRREPLRRKRRQRSAADDADRGETDGAAEHVPEDGAAIGAERDAHAELLRPLRYAARDHPVETDGCQQQACGPEHARSQWRQSRTPRIHRPRSPDADPSSARRTRRRRDPRCAGRVAGRQSVLTVDVSCARPASRAAECSARAVDTPLPAVIPRRSSTSHSARRRRPALACLQGRRNGRERSDPATTARQVSG